MHLHPKYVFRRVSPEQRPLAAVPLEEVVRERHLAARDVGALVFHDSPNLRFVSSYCAWPAAAREFGESRLHQSVSVRDPCTRILAMGWKLTVGVWKENETPRD